MATFNKDEVILGSGELYMMDYPSDGTIPEDGVIEVTANNVGHISGGASIEYKPTTYDVENDKREVLKRVVTKEEVTFKSGVLTFSNYNLQKLSTGTVTEDTTEITLKIGGGNALRRNLVRFVHTKDDGKKLRVTLVGSPTDGFTLTFAKDKETIVDAVIKALSQTDGTLVEIRDQIGA
jgi:hypothetical protein